MGKVLLSSNSLTLCYVSFRMVKVYIIIWPRQLVLDSYEYKLHSRLLKPFSPCTPWNVIHRYKYTENTWKQPKVVPRNTGLIVMISALCAAGSIFADINVLFLNTPQTTHRCKLQRRNFGSSYLSKHHSPVYSGFLDRTPSKRRAYDGGDLLKCNRTLMLGYCLRFHGETYRQIILRLYH